MQATKWVLGLGLAAGALLTAMEAKAVYVPPAGVTTQFKLTDATGFYTDVPTGEGTGTPAPRGTTPAVGQQDFTAFRITSIQEGSDPSFQPSDIGTKMLGLVSFLEYKSTFVPFVPGSPELGGTALLGDSTRPHTTAPDITGQGRATIGRFFLFDNPGGNEFFNAPGNQADDVVFNDTFVDANGGEVYAIDSLSGIVGGTLLATGSIVDSDANPFDGLISQVFFPSAQGRGVELESIVGGQLVFDGGVWFDEGVEEGSFSIHLYTIDADATADDIVGGPIRPDVFDGGWLASSEDPISLTREDGGVIPEPMTAGLGGMALVALGSYVTRRRRA